MTDLAARIVDDILRRRPFVPREEEIDGLRHAYEVQGAVNEALLAEVPGRRVAGYKIAFNRPSSMDYYGLAEPCHAPLFSDQVHASGAQLPMASFADLVVEPEIALRLVAPVAPEMDIDALSRAVEALPAIEIMDARGAFAHDPSAAAAVAQRVHSRGAVLGLPVRFRPDEGVGVRLSIDGTVVGEAIDAAPQPPLEALRWLIGALARQRRTLEPGMVVLTGTHLPARPVAAAGAIDVEFAPFGEVSLRLIG